MKSSAAWARPASLQHILLYLCVCFHCGLAPVGTVRKTAPGRRTSLVAVRQRLVNGSTPGLEACDAPVPCRLAARPGLATPLGAQARVARSHALDSRAPTLSRYDRAAASAV